MTMQINMNDNVMLVSKPVLWGLTSFIIETVSFIPI